MRGYTPGRFSFNVKGGRCEACQGDGIIKIEMHFLPDVYVPCEVCKGKRYNAQTLEVKYKGKSIADVLEMRVDEAAELFGTIPRIKNKLQTICEVGLGYIKMGQPATTLSGGEAQRIKLATELSKRATGRTFYVLDEPTTGLHFADIHKLLEVLKRLVEIGNTVLVIEHNLDVIKTADYVIDLGPEGGDKGGKVVAVRHARGDRREPRFVHRPVPARRAHRRARKGVLGLGGEDIARRERQGERPGEDHKEGGGIHGRRPAFRARRMVVAGGFFSGGSRGPSGRRWPRRGGEKGGDARSHSRPGVPKGGWTLSVPAGWSAEGSMLPGSSCNGATSPIYRALGPDGYTGAYLLPRTDWAWGAGVPPNGNCLPWHSVVSAKDFLTYLTRIQNVGFVRAEPVPELANFRRQVHGSADMARYRCATRSTGKPSTSGSRLR